MEQPPTTLTVGTLSLSWPSKKMKLQDTCGGKHLQGTCLEKALMPSCSCGYDGPKSPLQAMEYLSRSWNPSSTDFFHMLSSNQLLLGSSDEASEEDGKTAIKRPADMNRKDVRISVDHSFTWLRKGQQTQRTYGLFNVKKAKSWLDGIFVSHLSGEKKKEQSRLQSAQVQAALSVAQAATAVAGFISCSSYDTNHPKDSFYGNVLTGEVEDWNKKMSQAMGSAAALVAAVCAEAAESAGASRTQVASALSSGLAVEDASDMLTLTANAATCLRGAAVLKLREEQRRSFSISFNEGLLARGTELPVCANSGKIQVMVVSVQIKHENPMLRLEKRLWHGAITRYKEYRIIAVNDDIIAAALRQDVNGLSFLSIRTPRGDIRLLFPDVKLCKVWKISISKILHIN